MRLKKYIDEAYDYKSCEKYDDKIDRDICNWVRNERHLRWNKETREECMSRYGNVKVGTIFRGLRINTKEDLKLYKSLQNGGTINVEYVSASPNESTAKSFAWYMKSYDELAMLRALSRAIENGSAGTYGSALLILEPRPENVIFKTWVDGNERSSWNQPPIGLESTAYRIRIRSIIIW